jgi:hypothetical protein
MPTFDDNIWSEALNEAWSTNPAGTLVWETLEFRFTDAGVLTAARFVRNRQAVTATLESDAPLNPSTAVEFLPAAFDARLPSISETGGAPVLEITVGHVGRELSLHLEAAAYSPTPVRVTYRLYTNGDTTAPHSYPGPLHMDVFGIDVSGESVTARCRWDDLAGRRFPGIEYQARYFPSLATR